MTCKANVVLHLCQGGTFRKQFVWKTGRPRVAVDLTGYTARMQIRAKLEATTVLADLTTENGGITLGGSAGTIDLYLSDTATSAITGTLGVYDLELIAPNGDVTPLVGGVVRISPEVTR